MATRPVRIYFDFVDPLSYVASRLVSQAGAQGRSVLSWIGFELVPPPQPLTGGDDPAWSSRRDAVLTEAAALGLRLGSPAFVPWSRKAHELHLYAAGHSEEGRVRAAVFEAFFREDRDIGRVDVLVEIAASVGLDKTETKAVLDVDRYEAAVVAARREAIEAGVADVPCHFLAGRLMKGFPDPAQVGTLLPDE